MTSATRATDAGALAELRDNLAGNITLFSHHKAMLLELVDAALRSKSAQPETRLKQAIADMKFAIAEAEKHPEIGYVPAPAQSVPSAWQPIETAPRDGSEVLYFSPTTGRWIGNEPTGCARGNWKFFDKAWRGSSHGKRDETHWTEAPAPPSNQGASK